MPTTKNMSTEKAIMAKPSRMARSSPTLDTGICVRACCPPRPSTPLLHSCSCPVSTLLDRLLQENTNEGRFQDVLKKTFPNSGQIPLSIGSSELY
ncbi:hypothetical protein EYF80_035425 [Liparis tanakae]|uniref:Uncharacterized protein n=1 Tax=Liparis tanakae TaxID=230148 RepID=A0A4Z2GMB1_9TELE|nr:hypothetical protein EYF80_035425 [Liparis tanakae]